MARTPPPSKTSASKTLNKNIRKALERSADKGLGSLQEATAAAVEKHQQDAAKSALIQQASATISKQRLAQARGLARDIASPNLPSDYRGSLISQFQGVSSYASEKTNLQVQESQRKMAESRLRADVRRAELIQDPAARARQLEGIINSSQGVVSDKNRFLVDAQKKMAQSFDTSRASNIRKDIESDPSSAVRKIDRLSSMSKTESGDKTLKEIEKLLREQNRLVADDKRNFEKASSAHPATTAIFGREGPNGPGTMTAANRARINKIANIASGVGTAAAAAVSATNEFMRSGVRLEERTFLATADAQAMAARRNMGILGDFSGEGILKKYGDILLPSNENRYLGFAGMRRAKAEGISNVEQTRRQELRDAVLGGGAAIVGGAGLAAASLLGAVPSGGLSMLGVGAGIATALGGASSIFGSPAVQSTGILGKSRQDAALAGYARQAEVSSIGLTDADLARNLFASSGLQSAVDLRATDAAGLSAMGSDAVSFRGALKSNFNRNRSLAFQPGSFSDQVRAASGGRTSDFLESAAGLGLGAQDFTALANRTALAFDQKNRANPADNALMLRKLELSGRGSVDQLMANVQNLNKVGSGDSKQQLIDIFSKGVEKGFKGARLSQEFASAVTELMQRSGSTDAGSTASLISNLVSLGGGGERGLMIGRQASSDFGAMANNPLVKAMSDIGTVTALSGLQGEGRIGAVADAYSALDANQRIAATQALAEAFDPKNAGEKTQERLKSRMNPAAQLMYTQFKLGTGSSAEALKMVNAMAEQNKISMFGGQSGYQKFQDVLSSAKPGSSKFQLDMILDDAFASSGFKLEGATPESRNMFMAQFLSPEQKKQFGLTSGRGGGAIDESALKKFADLNRLNIKRLAFQNALAGGGESALTRSLLDDLQVGGRSGRTISEIAADENVNIDMKAFGNLGTRFSTEELQRSFSDPKQSRAILDRAEALTKDPSLAAPTDPTGKKVDEIARAMAFQTKLDVMDRLESERLGIDSISMVQITPGSATAIGEAVARATGRLTTRESGSVPPAGSKKIENESSTFGQAIFPPKQ